MLLGALTVIVVAAVVAAIAVANSRGGSSSKQASTASTTPPTTTTVPPVPVSGLDGLLPSPADVADAISAPNLIVQTKPEQSHAFYGDQIVDNDCVGVAFAVTQHFYEGTGWLSMRKQTLVDTLDNGPKKYWTTQGVVAFPDSIAATKFYHRAVDVFHRCANRNINLHETNEPDSPQDFWTVGQISEKDGILSTSLLEEGGNGWNCQRGVLVRNNIAIDTTACGYSMPDSVTPAVIKPIANKVDTAAR